MKPPVHRIDRLMAAHARSYAKRDKNALTAAQLRQLLDAVIAAGHGDRPVYYMGETPDGFTIGNSVQQCFASQPYDGEVVWLC